MIKKLFILSIILLLSACSSSTAHKCTDKIEQASKDAVYVYRVDLALKTGRELHSVLNESLNDLASSTVVDWTSLLEAHRDLIFMEYYLRNAEIALNDENAFGAHKILLDALWFAESSINYGLLNSEYAMWLIESFRTHLGVE